MGFPEHKTSCLHGVSMERNINPVKLRSNFNGVVERKTNGIRAMS